MIAGSREGSLREIGMQTEFYRALAPVYDELFPVDETVLAFLASSVADRSLAVVDVACGTGGYTEALGSRGLDVLGIDCDHTMIETGRRIREPRYASKLREHDMRRVDALTGSPFGTLFCIGNSISHLPGTEHIEAAIDAFARALAPGGILVFQCVDMEAITIGGERRLPIIETPIWRFLRTYERTSDLETRFRAELVDRRTGESVPIEQRLVHPRAQWYIDALERAGFTDVEVYGGFSLQSAGPDSWVRVYRAARIT